ncbi:MAG TPA: anhydro-N-acetylmuramic acid kinase [Ignavibacteria bacterium]|nr:anhydro-N-acetylmuramic acid kinase [Ignavibacteria bacterium]
MDKIVNLINKKSRTVIGILSGTSVDAVDVVLIKVTGKGGSSVIKVKNFKSYPINIQLKKHILGFSSNKSIKIEDVCRLNFIIGNLFADKINKFLKSSGISSEKVDLIGSHGQTVYHIPRSKKMFGFDSKSTLQLGDPSVIANKTGISVIGDFRVADIAAGGEGAPLVPYLDYILFSNKLKNRAFLNIGGISNVTYLRKNCSQNEIVAFDTGPGNMLIDSLMLKLFGKKFDKDGLVSLKGKVNMDLLSFLKSFDKYYKKKFPKSTGREYYGDDFVNAVLKFSKKIIPEDIITTVTKFTAFTIYFNLKSFKTEELIISGGGAKNRSLMHFLKEFLTGINIKSQNENGITFENKEAVLFAVLANELMNGNKTNINSVTGSDKNVFLGKLCIA